MRRLAAVLAALALAGCSLGRDAPVAHYVLQDGGAPRAAAASAPPGRPTLLVEATGAESFYDATAIAFSRSPGTRGAYQYAFWTERPGRALQRLLLARLDGAGLYAAVVPAAAGVAGDLELHTELDALYHDAASSPGVARVRVTAALVDRRAQRLVARRTFEREAPASAYSAGGAVDGFNAAVGGVLDDLVAWLQALPER